MPIALIFTLLAVGTAATLSAVGFGSVPFAGRIAEPQIATQALAAMGGLAALAALVCRLQTIGHPQQRGTAVAGAVLTFCALLMLAAPALLTLPGIAVHASRWSVAVLLVLQAATLIGLAQTRDWSLPATAAARQAARLAARATAERLARRGR